MEHNKVNGKILDTFGIKGSILDLTIKATVDSFPVVDIKEIIEDIETETKYKIILADAFCENCTHAKKRETQEPYKYFCNALDTTVKTDFFCKDFNAEEKGEK